MATEPNAYHIPVLLEETLRYLAPQPGETMLDATLGGGGHSVRLAERLQPGGTLIGLDRDPDALQTASARLAPYNNSLTIILLHSAFGKMEESLRANNALSDVSLDGVLFDLGVSSHQLDTARGFSFRRDEPLDMRMDATDDALSTAAEFLTTAREAEIARVLWEYGEERASRRIAHAIVERRKRKEPLETTAQLAALVESSVPRTAWPKDTHVATKAFQALRIYVNRELEELEAGLDAAVARLKPGGRIVVLSYHSLEDRIVKQRFAEWAGRTPNPPGDSPAALLPPTKEEPILTLLTRKPVTPTDVEIARNPRARSAKLRAAKKMMNDE
jgi:16S rRNA (cytosine1402-N4)-methyltransferase